MRPTSGVRHTTGHITQLLGREYRGGCPGGDNGTGLSFNDEDAFLEIKWRKFSEQRDHHGRWERAKHL